MKLYSYSIQGKRPTNEDQHVGILNIDGSNKKQNKINLLCVFDGHGGGSVSKYLHDNLPQFFTNKFKSDIFQDRETMGKYITKVYDVLQGKLKKDHPRVVQRCGSTANVIIQYKGKNNKDNLWVVNVGDSRCIKCNVDGKAEQLSFDHKPNEPSEKKRIETMGGKIQFDGSDWRIKDLSLSRAFGDIDCGPYVIHKPKIYKYKVNTGDRFIIQACDGLWDVFTNQEACNFIGKLVKDNFKGNFAKELASEAISKGSMDNVSVNVFFF